MNTEHIEEHLQAIVSPLDEKNFIFSLLRAYGKPPASIARLKKGDFNKSQTKNIILWPENLYFQSEKKKDLHVLIDDIQRDKTIIKHKPRFIIVTDFKVFLAVDTKNGTTLDIAISELPAYYDFFLPWAGMEKTEILKESVADRKAAYKMGKLYDVILHDNPGLSSDNIHNLNIFLSRLLFCFFAEDTGIFPDNILTQSVQNNTAEDGTDLRQYFDRLFEVLNTKSRSQFPHMYREYPYVNGGLFEAYVPSPEFSHKSRRIIIECGSLIWKNINPDILGSMMQAVVDPDKRGNLGMHYTSIVNIMKVIKPLFLDDLYQEFESAGAQPKKLKSLLTRLYNLRIFDPACGSGNFLIIAFKELCILEMEIFKRLQFKNGQRFMRHSEMYLDQFYGIEIDDFAHETAKLSLWLAEHQMNMLFKDAFGVARPTLPLKDSGQITCGNATRLEWNEICPKDDGKEIYILGNPPYLGFSMQEATQKADMKRIFAPQISSKRLDYINCWIWMASHYIRLNSAEFAFVSTNSVTQGEQVSLMWPKIFELGLEIGFAHQSFKWTNNAKGNAGVTCVIIGVRNVAKKAKYLYRDNIRLNTQNINSYLTNGRNIIVMKKTDCPISNFPPMTRGDMPFDGGHFMLSEEEKERLVEKNPESEQFLRKFVGASEFLKSTHRWCLWLKDGHRDAMKIMGIKNRVEAVKEMRINSKSKSTQALSKMPYLFGQIRHQQGDALLIPRHSSEARRYIPIGFVDSDTIIGDSTFAIYNPEPYIFGILTSRMHMCWVRAVGGRLKTDYRYSSGLCYNTFPFPDISKNNLKQLEDHAFLIIEMREKHPECTLAQLYDPDKMPPELLAAHAALDAIIDLCYRKEAFKDDEGRLSHLFNLYEKMQKNETWMGNI